MSRRFKDKESKRTPLSVIQKTNEYQRLTKKQQLFVAVYIGGIDTGIDTGNYDPVAATLAAYAVRDRGVAQRLSYAILSNIKIIDVLNMHFGTEPPEAFRLMLDRALRSKHLTPAQVQVLQLKAQILQELRESENGGAA